MKGLVDIISNYWPWILLVLFVAIFTYIGYYVDKKGYLDKNKKDKKWDDDKLVDIDDLSRQKNEPTQTIINKEEDLSSSFDVMPEVTPNEASEDLYAPFGDQEPEAKQDEISNEVSEDLYAPFGDQVIEENPTETKVSEVVSNDFSEKYSNVNDMEKNAKDINNGNSKKDVADLMKGEEQIDLDFDVEGSTDSIKTDNIFANSKSKDKKKKKEEVVDDMWKF